MINFQGSWFVNRSAQILLFNAKRWKVKQKWSAYRQPDSNTARALKYFDSYYTSVFGSDKWASMRLALLCRKSYGALVNRFSVNHRSIAVDLINLGANLIPPEPNEGRLFYLEEHISSKQQGFQDNNTPELSEQADENLLATEFALPPKNEGLDSFMPSPPVITPSDKKQQVEARLFVGPNSVVAEELGFSVPTEAWSFPVADKLLPPHLQILTFPATNVSLFPEPKVGKDGLLPYYLMDLASVFTVLALNPRPEDRILDICSAPGGKSLAIMQVCTPRQLVCVDKSPSRSKRLRYTLEAYLPGEVLEEVVEIYPGCDAISFADNHCASNRSFTARQPGFDKVLVDAPCLNDRISVYDDENNWFKPSRHKERLALPETQRDILIAALRCCAIGGVVVYSTCTLAPGQNDGVVFAALKEARDVFNVEAVVEDPEPFRKFITDRHMLNIDASWSRYGYLVAPILTANFGPSYCCRIKRMK